MKKYLLTMCAAMVALVIFAEDYTYPYLVFTGANGTQSAVAVDQLVITFSDGKLVATNATGTQTTLELSDLAAMQFSTAEELPTGVQAVNPAALNSQRDTYYDLSGRQAVRKNERTLVRKGIYVVRKSDGSTSKIAVK
ncbi:MAG: hypothetical protein IJ700_05035 [Bacteroidaceae bacterium]|nr:hypothetical protein [Bacteroidaceae bacterium]